MIRSFIKQIRPFKIQWVIRADKNCAMTMHIFVNSDMLLNLCKGHFFVFFTNAFFLNCTLPYTVKIQANVIFTTKV